MAVSCGTFVWLHKVNEQCTVLECYVHIWEYGIDWTQVNKVYNISSWQLWIYHKHDLVFSLFFIFKAKLWMFFSFNVFWGVIWRVNVYFTLLKQHSCGWFHPMKAVLMCITDYCMYLHMQHMNMDTDMTDIYIICLYLWICLSFKIQMLNFLRWTKSMSCASRFMGQLVCETFKKWDIM